MSIDTIFNGKVVAEPGVVAAKKAANSSPSINADYGTVFLISTGVSYPFGATPAFPFQTSGVNISEIPVYTSLDDFQGDIFAGPFAQAAQYLFKPSQKQGVFGALKVMFLKLCNATPSTATLSFGDSITVPIQTNNKYSGVWANSVEEGGALTKGFQIRMSASGSKYVFSFYASSYSGDDTFDPRNSGQPYFGQNKSTLLPQGTLLFQTTPCLTVQDLVNYCTTYGIFSQYFDKNAFIAATSSLTGEQLAYAFTSGVVTPETKATSTVTVTAIGEVGDELDISLTEPNGGPVLNLGTYTQLVTDTTPTLVAASVAATINATTSTTGVVATSAAAVVTIKPPAGLGASINTYSVSFTGPNFAFTNVAFSGGVNGVYGDLQNNSMVDFTGGTESTDSGVTDAFLDYITDANYNFIISDDEADGDFNQLFVNHVETEAKFDKFVATGLLNDYITSMAIAAEYNNEKVIHVQGNDFGLIFSYGNKYLNFFHKICFCIGRIAGLAPQIPGTFKDVAYDFEVELTTAQRVDLLHAGVLHTKYDDDFNYYVINQSISTLQAPANQQFIASDGQSYELSVTRIGFELNKILYLKARFTFQQPETGSNRFSADTNTTEQFTITTLKAEMVTDTEDGLITYYSNVKSNIVEDSIFTNYTYSPNFPINKMFFTGYQLDQNVN